MAKSEFMNVKEVAEHLRLQPLAVYRKVKAKQIPFRRAGRSIRFIKSEIEAWMRWGSL